MKPAINQLLTDDVDKSFDQGKVYIKNVKIMDLKLLSFISDRSRSGFLITRELPINNSDMSNPSDNSQIVLWNQGSG